ncbi:unnamed protein product [Chrysoparadoxa australica]
MSLQQKLGDANNAFSQGRIDDALTQLNEVVRQAPQLPDPYKTLSMIYLHHLHKPDKALLMSIVASNLDNNNVDQQKNTALLAMNQGNVKAALDCIKRACQLEPKDMQLQVDKAKLLLELDRRQEARNTFLAIAASNKDNLHLLFELASEVGSTAEDDTMILVAAAQLYLACLGIIMGGRFLLPKTREMLSSWSEWKLKEAGMTDPPLGAAFQAVGALSQVLVRGKKARYELLEEVIESLANWLAHMREMLKGKPEASQYFLPCDLAAKYGMCKIRLKKSSAALLEDCFKSVLGIMDEDPGNEVCRQVMTEVAEAYTSVNNYKEAMKWLDHLSSVGSEEQKKEAIYQKGVIHHIQHRFKHAAEIFGSLMESSHSVDYRVLTAFATAKKCMGAYHASEAVDTMLPYIQAAVASDAPAGDKRAKLKMLSEWSVLCRLPANQNALSTSLPLVVSWVNRERRREARAKVAARQKRRAMKAQADAQGKPDGAAAEKADGAAAEKAEGAATEKPDGAAGETRGEEDKEDRAAKASHDGAVSVTELSMESFSLDWQSGFQARVTATVAELCHGVELTKVLDQKDIWKHMTFSIRCMAEWNNMAAATTLTNAVYDTKHLATVSQTNELRSLVTKLTPWPEKGIPRSSKTNKGSRAKPSSAPSTVAGMLPSAGSGGRQSSGVPPALESVTEELEEVKRSPANWAAWNAFSTVCQAQGVHVTSSILHQALKQHAKTPQFQLLAGNALMTKNWMRKAADAYQEALHMQPKEPLLLLCLATCLTRLALIESRVDEPITCAGTVQALMSYYAQFRREGESPTDPRQVALVQETLFNIGRVYQELVMQPYAEHFYLEVLEGAGKGGPLTHEAAFNLVQLYKQGGELGLAQHFINTYLTFG